MISGESGRKVCAQKDISRGVSDESSPTLDLNHWRSESTRLTKTIGTLKRADETRVMSSRALQGTVSKMLSECKNFKRSVSFCGRQAPTCCCGFVCGGRLAFTFSACCISVNVWRC